MHFCLENIEALVHIGITDEERNTAQLLIFRVDFEFDPHKAIQTDDIADTVDYQVIYDTIKSFTASKQWNLLETLHQQLLTQLQKQCPKAQNLELKITKSPWEDAQITVQ